MYFNTFLIYNIYYMVQRVVEAFFSTPCNPLSMKGLEAPEGWSKGWSRKRRTNPPAEGTINNKQ